MHRELLGSISERKRSGAQCLGFFFFFFSFFPYWLLSSRWLYLSRWGWKQTCHLNFFPWLQLACHLPVQVFHQYALSLLVLPPKKDGVALGVELMAYQIAVQFFTIKTFSWFAFFLWSHRGWSSAGFQNASNAKITRRNIHLLCACAHSWAHS